MIAGFGIEVGGKTGKRGSDVRPGKPSLDAIMMAGAEELGFVEAPGHQSDLRGITILQKQWRTATRAEAAVGDV